jgi:hypothetical protein
MAANLLKLKKIYPGLVCLSTNFGLLCASHSESSLRKIEKVESVA